MSLHAKFIEIALVSCYGLYAETPENGSTLGWPGIAHTYCGSF